MSNQAKLMATLDEHLTCSSNCAIDVDGVRDGRMWYIVRWSCGKSSGPLTLGTDPITSEHRDHLVEMLVKCMEEISDGLSRRAPHDQEKT